MSGLSHLDLFTLKASGGAPLGRLYAALAVSCLLHAMLYFAPYMGASTPMVRPDELGTQAAGPARMLDVRMQPAGGPAAQPRGRSETGAGAAAVPARPPIVAETNPQQQMSRGAELLPVPAPDFYVVDQLTKSPVPLLRPELEVPNNVARAVRGNIVLNVWIDEFGNVVSVAVEQSSLPPAVTGLAAKSFRTLRYEPGEIDGRKVAVQLKVEVNYDNRLKRP